MALYGVSITKNMQWRNTTEDFSNVYHYQLATTLDDTALANLVSQLVTAEKLVHTGNVTWKQGRVWLAGGTPAQNVTKLITDLSGTGSLTIGEHMYRELCVLIKFTTNRVSSTGRKITLKKFVHAESLPSTGIAQVEGAAALTSSHKTPFQTYGDSIRELTLTGGTTVFLSSPNGQQVSDSLPVVVDDWLRVRQFKQ